MKNFAYKFVVFTLTFFLVFNTASIAHAYTYETTDNVIKLDLQNSFFLKDSSKKITDNLISNNNSSNIEEITSQFLASYFNTELLFIPTTLFFSFIMGEVSFLFQNTSDIVVSIVLSLLTMFFIIDYLVLNSFSTYFKGSQKNKHSYFMPLLGTILGYFLYMAIITSSIFLESISINGGNSLLTFIQEFLLVIIMPLFSSAGATIFYDMSEEKSTPNEPIKTSMSSEELMNKIKKDFSFAEKIKVKNGAISLKIAGF